MPNVREPGKTLPEKVSVNMVAFLSFLDERILGFPKICNIKMRHLGLTKQIELSDSVFFRHCFDQVSLAVILGECET